MKNFRIMSSSPTNALRRRLEGFGREEGFGMDNSVEYLGSDKEDRNKEGHKKRNEEKRELGIVKKLKEFRRQYSKTGTRKTHEYGTGSRQNLRTRSLKHKPNAEDEGSEDKWQKCQAKAGVP